MFLLLFFCKIARISEKSAKNRESLRKVFKLSRNAEDHTSVYTVRIALKIRYYIFSLRARINGKRKLKQFSALILCTEIYGKSSVSKLGYAAPDLRLAFSEGDVFCRRFYTCLSKCGIESVVKLS